MDAVDDKMSEEFMCYVGIAPCGCIQAATMDTSENTRKRNDVSSFLKWGSVERVPVETIRKQLCLTKHPKNICPHPEGCPSRMA
jgi:hypothetical protein